MNPFLPYGKAFEVLKVCLFWERKLYFKKEKHFNCIFLEDKFLDPIDSEKIHARKLLESKVLPS